MSNDTVSSRPWFEFFLIFVIFLMVVCVLILIFFPPIRTLPDHGSGNLIYSIKDFEKSQFCQNYGCVLAGRFEIDRGIDNAYQIKNYPVYNDFLVEITTNDNRIIDFGISLDPKRISSNELQFIKIFLTSFLNNKTLNSDVMDFIQQNLNQSVFQICESRSIQFDLMHLWVGNIGGVPTILVAKNCPR